MDAISPCQTRPKRARPAWLLAAGWSMAACATTSATSEKPEPMFVQVAADLKVDPAAKTLPS